MALFKIGVSSCLLGEKVRFDGGHKRDHYICDILGNFAQYVKVCPEADCGLPIPREAMHLAGDKDNPRLVTVRSNTDYTGKMQSFTRDKVKALAKENLDAFIFKSKSPSSGMVKVKVYDKNNIPAKTGVGIFARIFMENFPMLPVEEDGRLHDPLLRENFIDKLLFQRQRRLFLSQQPKVSTFCEFHARHKYLLMAHNPQKQSAAGQIVASANKDNIAEKVSEYFKLCFAALDSNATVKKKCNVLQHIAGYFKDELDSFEKQELHESIELFRTLSMPFLAPLVLLRHYARKYRNKYLLDQAFLNPQAVELALKYHL